MLFNEPKTYASNGPPYYVDLHVNAGESVAIQWYDGKERVLSGPATITMISQHIFPPVPMPVQMPPGHMIQQIVDENGTLKHIILSATNCGTSTPGTITTSASATNNISGVNNTVITGGGGGGGVGHPSSNKHCSPGNGCNKSQHNSSTSNYNGGVNKSVGHNNHHSNTGHKTSNYSNSVASASNGNSSQSSQTSYGNSMATSNYSTTVSSNNHLLPSNNTLNGSLGSSMSSSINSPPMCAATIPSLPSHSVNGCLPNVTNSAVTAGSGLLPYPYCCCCCYECMEMQQLEMSKPVPTPTPLPPPPPPPPPYGTNDKNDYITNASGYTGNKSGRNGQQSVGVSLITYAQPPPPLNAALSSSNNSSSSGGGRNNSNKRSAPTLSSNNNNNNQSSSQSPHHSMNGCISQTAVPSTIPIPSSNGLLMNHPKLSPYGNKSRNQQPQPPPPLPSNVVYSNHIGCNNKQSMVAGEPVDPNRARANLALALAQNLPYHQPIALPSLGEMQLAAGFAPLRPSGGPSGVQHNSSANNWRRPRHDLQSNHANGNNCKHSQTGQHFSSLGNNCPSIRSNSFANGAGPTSTCQSSSSSSSNRYPNRSPPNHHHSLISLNGMPPPTTHYHHQSTATLHSPTSISASTAKTTTTAAAATTNTSSMTTNVVITTDRHCNDLKSPKGNGSCSPPSEHYEFGSNDSELNSGDSNVSPIHSTLNKRLSSLQPNNSSSICSSPSALAASKHRTSRSSNNSPKKSNIGSSFRKLLVRKQSGDALLDLIGGGGGDGSGEDTMDSESTLNRLRPDEVLQVNFAGSRRRRQSDQPDITTSAARTASASLLLDLSNAVDNSNFDDRSRLNPSTQDNHSHRHHSGKEIVHQNISKKSSIIDSIVGTKSKSKNAVVCSAEKTRTKPTSGGGDGGFKVMDKCEQIDDIDQNVDQIKSIINREISPEDDRQATISDVCSTLEVASQTDLQGSDERVLKDESDSCSQRLVERSQRSHSSSSSSSSSPPLPPGPCAIKSIPSPPTQSNSNKRQEITHVQLDSNDHNHKDNLHHHHHPGQTSSPISGSPEFETIDEDNFSQSSSSSTSSHSEQVELAVHDHKEESGDSPSHELSSSRCKQSELPQVLAFRLVYTSLSTSTVKLKWSQSTSASGLISEDLNVQQISANVQSFQVEMWQGRCELDRLNNISTSTNTTSRPHSRLVYNGPVKHCKVQQLLPEQEYSFRVRAVGVNNVQQMFLLLSNTLTITTPKCNAQPIVNGITAQQLTQQPLFAMNSIAIATAAGGGGGGGRKRNSSRQSLQQQIAQQQLITQQLLLQQQQQQKQQQQLMQQQQEQQQSANRSSLSSLSSSLSLLTTIFPWTTYGSRFSRDQHCAFGLLLLFCGVACTVAYMAQQLIDG